MLVKVDEVYLDKKVKLQIKKKKKEKDKIEKIIKNDPCAISKQEQ